MADPLDNLTSSEQLKRLLLQEEQERIDRLEARLGDDDALKGSLIPIIADVLRDAGVKDYRRLADALAPIVLQSIKTEIHNSRDMMVDALYPITGRLVAAAVRNAFKDLVDQLNSKLDSTLSADRWRAKFKAKLSGRSEAEVLLSEGATFEIVDLLLINRQSGLLIAQAVVDADQEGTSSHLLSSILTAIMAFVRDAMSQSSEQDLRTLHVGDVRLHLQVSPSAILAIKTKGPPPAGFETALSETFYAFLSRWGHTLSEPGEIESHHEMALTEDLEERFHGLLKAKQSNFRKPSNKGAILLGSFAAAILLWIGWTVYKDWSNDRIEMTAQSLIDRQVELNGYPIRVQYVDASETIEVAGLFPSQDAVEGLRSDLENAFPDIQLSLDVSTLPNQTLDPKEISTRADLAEVQGKISKEMMGALTEAQSILRADVTKKLAELEDILRAETATTLAESRRTLREETVDELDRKISSLSDALASIKQRIPTGVEAERAAFHAWLIQQSVRFDDDSQLNDEARAKDLLKEINDRLSRLPRDLGIRIIGYGDSIGEERVNTGISRSRATLVAEMLNATGVPLERLQIVGRGNEKRIDNRDGTGSINRRVEFEITYNSNEEAMREAGHGSR